MSLLQRNQAPAPQWRYTNATDADARAVQAMFWARQWGYSNTNYLEKLKMGTFSVTACMTNTFKRLEVPLTARLPAVLEKCMSLFNGVVHRLGRRIGTVCKLGVADRCEPCASRLSNPVASYALSTAEGGLIPNSSTARSDWERR
ncbi:glycoside hydrolase family 48 protein [Bacillus licheniformis]|nr:glycoside hydrolase family 48 protein [Bacillus licheniformis]